MTLERIAGLNLSAMSICVPIDGEVVIGLGGLVLRDESLARQGGRLRGRVVGAGG